ncbi:uncharacterized protein LOC116170783 [Photinus pyralis]|uniref:uncharacterized protein LOC116170783 n=1 Tax=Photinus pyralis TaxID=7054 RepID=UPI001267206E|nr:uncharacterized protein LOC116170783 [Photinus pyralis]
MSEQSVADLLEQWGFPELVLVFEENEITWEAFESLTDDVIKELIPKIGPRIIFKKKYDLFRAPVITVQSAIEYPNTLSPSPSISSAISETLSVSSCTSDAEAPGPSYIEVTTSASYNDIDGNAVIKKNAEELRKLLLNSNKGKMVMSYYDKHKKFNDSIRDKLTDTIIEGEVADDIDKRMSSDRFESLAAAINALFPTENKERFIVDKIGQRKTFSKIL